MEEENNNEYEEERPVLIDAELIDKLTNPEPLLERIEIYLRGGKIQKTATGEFKVEYPRGAKPLLNEKGIQEILQIMRCRLDQLIYSTSILDPQYIREEVFFFNLNLIRIVIKKAKEWELDPIRAGELIDYLVSSYEAILRKGLYGKFMNSIFGIKTEEKKRSWLPW